MMQQAMAVIREDFLARGGRFDDTIDPNHTGLIGEEYTGLTTTVGSADAKRTTTNPNMAALVVRLMHEAGVRSGDTIAVGCSGSFPALLVATLAAAKALEVTPILIVSAGSSSFGATRPGQTLLDLLEVLRQQTDIGVPAAAVSLGGSHDVGKDLDPETRNLLLERMRAARMTVLNEPDLAANVHQRMQIYAGSSPGRRIAAFVNIGGSYADMGTSPLILDLESGVNTEIRIPPEESTHGVVFAMAKRHIPIIHLLHIKGLVLKYGLPWDPVPLPAISGTAISQPRSPVSKTELAIGGVYFASIALVVIVFRRAFFRKYS